jgi:hypothetical protein
MASDRARITYDEQRKYRSVVMQQGRVSLEADFNENVELENEVDRRVTLDVVGPTGTPDHGYGIGATLGSGNAREVWIGNGTMYVGGIRVSLPWRTFDSPQMGPWSYESQPDWRHMPQPDTTKQREIVWLELFEQEISAVEDRALREVALGGPDTAARLRIMQRIHRTAINADNCKDAFLELIWQWAKEGYEFDEKSMRKSGSAKLAVGFEPPATPVDPCDPTAAGGYLEADNQLIRVAITSDNPSTSKHRLVWSYDNASFIYSVVDRPAGGNALKIGSRPVDDEHTPRPNQYAELLRGMALLDTALLDHDTLAAEPFGPILRIAAYDPDEQLITLDSAMPPDYQSSGVLYVRIWESVVDFTDGQAVPLGTTGVRVTPSAFGSPFAIGEYWTFAVRPGTPTVVYPERYLQAIQPPEGFRRWACPLAVIDWGPLPLHPGEPVVDPAPQPLPVADVERAAFGSGASYPRVSDCRQHFEDLVTLTKRRESCCIILRPSDLDTRTLQQIIDAHKGKPGMTFCLTPGRYRLSSPLVLTREHGAITIEGCGRGVIIESDNTSPFTPGMVQLLDTVGVRLRNLEFEAPALDLRIAVRVADAADCTIESCTFRFPVPPPLFFNFGSLLNKLGAALLASGSLTRCSFHDNLIESVFGAGPTAGFVFTPALFRASDNIRRSLPCLLDGVRIEKNQFMVLSHAVLICASLNEVAVRENSISECGHGIIMISSHWFPAIVTTGSEVITRIATPITKDATGKPVLNTGGVLSQEVKRLRGLVAHEMAVSALLLATHAVLHPTIVVPLRVYATSPFPADGASSRVALPNPPAGAGATTSIWADLLVRVLGEYAERAEPFELFEFLQEDVVNDLVQAWSLPSSIPSPTLPADFDLLQSDLSSFFDNASTETTSDVSHNTVSRSNQGLRGLALLTLHDDGARRLQDPSQPLDQGAGWIFLNLNNAPITLKWAAVRNRTTTSSNDFRTDSRFFPAAMMLLERRCTVTGNVIANEVTPIIREPGSPLPESSITNPIAIQERVAATELVVPPVAPPVVPPVITHQTNEFAPSLVIIAVPDRPATVRIVPDPKLTPTQRPDLTDDPIVGTLRFDEVMPGLLATTVTGNSFTGWPILPKHTFRYYAVVPWLQLNTIED